MNYAIYGAGSLGTVLGAFLTKNGVPIQLVNRNRAHVEALFPDEMKGPYDVILLMTKQLNNPEVVSFLKPMLAPDGVLVTLQNGIPEPGVAKIVGPERTVGCVVEWGANLAGPGHSVLTSAPEALSFHMGGMPGVSAEKLERVRALLEHMCPVAIEENLIGARWSKLLINATFSGLGTVVGGTFGDVSGVPGPRRLAVRCMKECIDVGRASGAVFAPVQGKDVTKLFYYRTPLKRKFAELLVPLAMKKHVGIVPSMLQDIRAGKPCEIDAINGVVCAFGRKYGVPTPINDRIVETVRLEQTGALAPAPENIRRFDDLL